MAVAARKSKRGKPAAAGPEAGFSIAPRIHQDFGQFYQTELTPDRAKRILRAAASGDPYEQAALFDEMLETDGDLDNAYRTRLLGFTGLPWEIVSALQVGRYAGKPDPANEALAEEIAEYCRDVCDNIEGFGELLVHLADAVGRSVSVGQFIWDSAGGDKRPVAAEPVRHTQLRIDPQEPQRLRILAEGDWRGRPLDEFADGQFIVHQPRSLGGSFFRGGLHRAAVVGHMFKRSARKSWMFGIEVFGLPISVVKYDGTDAAVKTQILKMISDLGVGRGGLFPKGCEFEFADVSKQGQWPHERLMAYIEAGYSKLYLGQTLTTQIGETGGANAAAQVHDEVREDIRNDDIRAESCTLRDQLLRPLVLYKFGERGAKLIPHLRRVIEEARDDAADMAILKAAVNELGYPVPQRYVKERFSLPTIDEAQLDEALPGRPQSSFDPFGAGVGGQGSGDVQLTRNRANIRLVANSALTQISGRKSAMAKLIPWVITAALASQAHSEEVVQRFSAALEPLESGQWSVVSGQFPEEISRALAAAFEALPTADLQELARQGLLAAELAGRSLAKEQMDKIHTINKMKSNPVNPVNPVDSSVLVANVEGISFEKLPFVEAIQSFQDRIGMTPDEFIKLDREARSRAWRVAGVWDMDLLAVLHTNLARSIADGETVRDFRQRVLPSMLDREGWTGENPWHSSVVFYQNFAMATAAGRFRQYDDLAVGHWRFTNTGDSCPICLPHVGKVFSTRDTNRTPPLHFWCDCDAEPVFEQELQPGEVTHSNDVSAPALVEERSRPSGFQWDPRHYGALEPIDLAKYPTVYHEAFRRMAEARGLKVAA